MFLRRKHYWLVHELACTIQIEKASRFNEQLLNVQNHVQRSSAQMTVYSYQTMAALMETNE